MRKRSKYRPKPVLTNPIAYVMESFTPVSKHGSYLVNLKIRNHAALAALTQGKATKLDIDTLMNMVNMVDALYRLGFGKEYVEQVKAGLDALYHVGVRGVKTGRFILKAPEMKALNEIMELHDAQMEVVTVHEMERALKLIREEFRAKRMRSLEGKKHESE